MVFKIEKRLAVRVAERDLVCGIKASMDKDKVEGGLSTSFRRVEMFTG
jgi:hypothetical protein